MALRRLRENHLIAGENKGLTKGEWFMRCGSKVKTIFFSAMAVGILMLSGCSSKKISTTAVTDASYRVMTKTEDGYYFLDYIQEGKGRLMINYLPTDGDKAVPLCNKANCKHRCDVEGCVHDGRDTCELKDCDAHITDYNSYDTGILSYDGKLYFIMLTKDGQGLYTVSADGAKRELVGIVDENRQADIDKFTLYKGYMYYSIRDYKNKTESLYIYKVNLNDMTDKTQVFQADNAHVGVNDMRGYEEGLFFNIAYLRTGEYVEDIDASVAYELYQITDGGAEKVIDRDDIMGFVVNDGWLYYYAVGDSSLYRYDLKTDVTEKLYKAEDNTIYSLWSDSNYIYLDNEPYVRYCTILRYGEYPLALTVLEKDGTFVKNIEFNTSRGHFVGGDDKYMFYNYFDTTRVYDKSSMDSGVTELRNVSACLDE